MNQAEDIHLVDAAELEAFHRGLAGNHGGYPNDARVALLKKLEDLREYEWMYKDLCK